MRRNNNFTLFEDNLPLGMNNVWLKQIFKNDELIVDAYVSLKMRKNKNSRFGFVLFNK